MAGWARKLGAVVGIAVLGGAGGFAGGKLSSPAVLHPRPMTSDPLAAVPTLPSASPTPSTPTLPPSSRTPVPDDSPPLRAADLEYHTVEASLVLKDSDFTSEVTAETPRGWEYSEDKNHSDWAIYKDRTGKRWVRIESGYTIRRPTTASMSERIAKLKLLDPDQQLRLGQPSTTKVIGSDGQERTFSTLTYTYLPPQGISTRYVLLRWIGFGDGQSAVEMAVTGLPQDAKALEVVMDRASKSVTRKDH